MPDPIEEFALYRDDLLARLGDQDPIEVLSETVGRIRELTEGVPGERMTSQPAPGEWSAHQVLGHLCDTDLVYGVRIRMMVTQDKPVIVGYDQDAWARRFASVDETARQTYLRWRWLREANLRMYRTLSDEEWERVGLHTERGEESVRLSVNLLAGHDLMHVDQLAHSLI